MPAVEPPQPPLGERRPVENHRRVGIRQGPLYEVAREHRSRHVRSHVSFRSRGSTPAARHHDDQRQRHERQPATFHSDRSIVTHFVPHFFSPGCAERKSYWVTRAKGSIRHRPPPCQERQRSTPIGLTHHERTTSIPSGRSGSNFLFFSIAGPAARSPRSVGTDEVWGFLGDPLATLIVHLTVPRAVLHDADSVARGYESTLNPLAPRSRRGSKAQTFVHLRALRSSSARNGRPGQRQLASFPGAGHERRRGRQPEPAGDLERNRERGVVHRPSRNRLVEPDRLGQPDLCDDGDR